MGDLSGALPYYEQALAIRQETLGVRHPDTAQSLNSLGYLQKALGNLSEAWLFYEQALTILEERLGLEHPNTRIVRGNLAALLAEMEEGDSE
jgi:tetratricopeptide (TPR) repeat protein